MSFMVGESGTSRNSTTYRYYKCIDAKRNKGCDKKAVKKDRIEDLVINQIIRVLWDDELIDSLADMVIDLQSKENTTLPLLKKQLAETEKSINNMLDAIQQGIITSSTKKRLEDLENQKKEIEINIAQESIKKPMLTKEQVVFWFERLRKVDITDIKHRKRLVDSFVNSIILHDDRIEFYFNYKKGANTLSISELEKSSDLLNSPPPILKIALNIAFRAISFLRFSKNYMP